MREFVFKGGSVININSIARSNSMPNAALYSTIKAAVENLTQGLSAELGPRKIRVNAIAPGYTGSEGTKAEGLLALASSVLGWKRQRRASIASIGISLRSL